MNVAVQVLLLVGGLAVAIVASDRAIAYARALAAGIGMPPFLVGVVLVSIGTDLPEIANSIASHLQGQADVNVGDSLGSTLTQYTLVLGLFPLVIAKIAIDRRQMGLVSLLTIAGLGLTTFAVSDGNLGRADGILLVVAWAVFTLVLVWALPSEAHDEPPPVRHEGRLRQAGLVLVALAFVAAGATLAVRALVRLAEYAGVPEFFLAFFGASLGTSAPEIAVDVTALLRGAPAIALGDALGSSLVDATLSIGVGPIVAPGDVTTRLAVTAAVYSAVAVAVVGTMLSARRLHDRLGTTVLFGLYGLAYVVLLGAE